MLPSAIAHAPIILTPTSPRKKTETTANVAPITKENKWYERKETPFLFWKVEIMFRRQWQRQQWYANYDCRAKGERNPLN